MIRIGHQEAIKYSLLFSAYRHSIPLIYSSLEGQYPGEILFDEAEGSTLAILTTPFCFHFAAGDPSASGAWERMHHMLFEVYLKETQQTEAVVFCPDASWHPVLEKAFGQHHGLKDVRKRFALNEDRFRQVESAMIPPAGVHTTIAYEQDGAAAAPYPICRVMKENACVSFCSAFILGKGHAELDVGTEEGFRRQGYAKLAAVTLIAELIKNHIEPDWCTWPYRTESQALALSIGFEPLEDVPAFIWTEADCGKLD